MKRLDWILVFLLPFFLLAGVLRAEGVAGDFRVEVVCDRQKVVSGDSCLLSCVLYATHPFVVKHYAPKPKLRRGSLRAVTERGDYLQRGMRGNQMVYYVVAQQYVLRTKVAATLVVPELEFEVELQVPQEPQDPFELFFGSQRPPEKVRRKAKSAPFELMVVEKPQRTMKQMMDSGIQVL